MVRYRLMELIADRQFQEQRRVSLEEVALGSGVHRATLSKIINRHGYHASLDALEKLCAYFGVGVSELVEFVSDPEPKPKPKRQPPKKGKKGKQPRKGRG